MRAELGEPVAGITVVRHFETNMLPIKVQVRRVYPALPVYDVHVRFVHCCRGRCCCILWLPRCWCYWCQLSMAFVNEVVEFAAADKRSQEDKKERPAAGNPTDQTPDLFESDAEATSVLPPVADDNRWKDVRVWGGQRAWELLCAAAYPSPAVLRGNYASDSRSGVLGSVPSRANSSRGETPANLRSNDDVSVVDAASSDVSTGDLSIMKQRAATIMTFKYVRIGDVLVHLSFKGAFLRLRTVGSVYLGVTPHCCALLGDTGIEDVNGAEVRIHTLVYHSKTCTVERLLMRMKKDIILDVLSQVRHWLLVCWGGRWHACLRPPRLLLQVGRNFSNIGVFVRDKFWWVPHAWRAIMSGTDEARSAAADEAGAFDSPVAGPSQRVDGAALKAGVSHIPDSTTQRDGGGGASFAELHSSLAPPAAAGAGGHSHPALAATAVSAASRRRGSSDAMQLQRGGSSVFAAAEAHGPRPVAGAALAAPDPHRAQRGDGTPHTSGSFNHAPVVAVAAAGTRAAANSPPGKRDGDMSGDAANLLLGTDKVRGGRLSGFLRSVRGLKKKAKHKPAGDADKSGARGFLGMGKR